MTIHASEFQKRSTATALVSGPATRPGAVSSFLSSVSKCLAAFFISSFVFGPAAALAEEAQEPTTLQVLASGQYQGIWRDESGESNALLVDFNIDGQSIRGKLTVIGVEDYSGDKIRGTIEQNEDGTLTVEFQTRDRFWKSKAIFDGQLLVGTYIYEFNRRGSNHLLKGEWAAQRAGD